MTHTPIPHDLHDAVLALPFECASDGRLARHAVAHPERATRATVQWLAALVARGGARYDDRNPAHSGPHEWPLKSGHAAAAVTMTRAAPAAASGSASAASTVATATATAMAAAGGAGAAAPSAMPVPVPPEPPRAFSTISAFLP